MKTGIYGDDNVALYERSYEQGDQVELEVGGWQYDATITPEGMDEVIDLLIESLKQAKEALRVHSNAKSATPAG